MNTFDIFELPLYWEMVNAEKIALLNILKDIKPCISIEIGTRKGGSLQLIAALSEEVYCLDIDPAIEELGNTFSNTHFVIGDSKETLPILLRQLADDGKQADFILIDGDHSMEGVKADIDNILKINISRPLTVLMHDSFNPDCRQGMLDADYTKNPFVDTVDIDFIQGIYSPSESTRAEMWGGFGMIYLKPDARPQTPLIKRSSQYSYERLYHLSTHYHFKARTLTARLRALMFRKIFK